MKKLFFLFAFLSSVAVTAQATVDVQNSTSVPIDVRIHRFDVSCGYVTFDTQTIPSGFNFVFSAPAGEEYTYLDFASAAGLCSPGFSGTVGTPSTSGCSGTCTYAGPSTSLGPTNSCGTQTWVSARWTNCGPLGGLVIIADF